MNDSVEKICSICEKTAFYDEPLYEYESEIYCFDCLVEQLKGEGSLRMFTIKHYVSDGGTCLGSEEDTYSLSQEICEYYGAKRIEGE